MLIADGMADREERKFAEVPRDSVKMMAESVGVELSDDIAAMLAEDVCYRLREAAQVRQRRYGFKYNRVIPVTRSLRIPTE